MTTLNWRHVVNGVALVGILVVAGIVTHTTPDEEQQQGPIVVRGEIGDELTGRNIRATVTDVRIAESVTASNGWAGTTPGVWVVVDASVEAVVDDTGASLGTAVIQVGDTTYSASVRPARGSIAEAVLDIGIATTGPLMFELPADLVESAEAGAAEIHLALNDDPRADSMLVVPVDLTAIPIDESIETDAQTWGGR
ncbi:hypothetical protein HD599_003372 [Conyzicola lurida]|uniref:DUF4352 domain-containing protein n=1 Tax=Conyzicola lurida TaxID=1172621 RepID=A0A841AUG2_9MICO|nr:hypothetical protein [Conyzicola lurida]MBB5845049.1 hypothetical protein [Conyzicola lurida]